MPDLQDIAALCAAAEGYVAHLRRAANAANAAGSHSEANLLTAEAQRIGEAVARVVAAMTATGGKA